MKTVLTDIYGRENTFWANNTRYCERSSLPKYASTLLGKGGARRIAEILSAIKLFSKRSSADAYITSGDLAGIVLALLQRLFPKNRIPHVLIDCLWYKSESQFKAYLFSRILKISSPAVSKFVVWATHELQDYPEAFGLDVQKFEYVPFWHTLGGYEFEILDERFVFAGGNYDRDYGMVLKAAQNLPEVEFRIGTTRAEQLESFTIPPNVKVIGYTPDGFRQAIASCSIMLVPMAKGLLHSGGQQTVLNAMYMGKPTIAVGRKWARDLIEDHVDGFIVDYADSESMTRLISSLWHNLDECEKISQKAIQVGQKRSPESSLRKIHEIATEFVNGMS